MLINLKDFPKESGVYLFKVNEEVVYVGSSKNLYNRMTVHNTAISRGSSAERNPVLYQFLQSNQFTVQFQLTDDYRQLEQQLIEKHNPKYNAYRANTGLGAEKGREAEYEKEYRQKFKEEIKQYQKQYQKQHYEEHKEEIKQQQKQYKNQQCSYNGETLTLNTLSKRFRRKGVSNPTTEAKKFLI